MALRASSIMLCTLGCVLLAGCGASPAVTTAPPTPIPHKTADIAAVQNQQATAVAVANATSVAVQHIAQTAVARLQSIAHTQSQKQNAANAAATAAANPVIQRPPPPPTPRPVVVHVLPTATPKPVNHPAHTVHHPAKKHTGFAVLASIACCPKTRFKNAAEKRSSTFSVNGSWLLRWSTNCKNVPSSQQPIMYIAVIPAGSKNPIQFIQEPMPSRGTGSGLATENLHGRYYLDAISACHIFGAVAYGQRGAHVSAGTQASAISEARGKGQGVALKAVRTSLLIHAHSHSKTRANARALALARARYIADLSAIVSQVSAARKTLSTASGSINSTSSDFDPSILKAAKDYANAASQELRASNRQLESVKTFPKHGKLKLIIKSAIAHLNDAVTLVLQTTDDIAAGNTDTATSELATAVAKIKTGTRQIKHAERNLTLLKTTK